MNEKKFQPIALPMNREESSRYAGIRQALMDPPKGYAEYDLARSYGVHIPNQGFVTLAQQAQQDDQAKPPQIGGGMPFDGMTPDGGVPDLTGGQPSDGGMAAAAMAMPSMAPQPGMMAQPNPMQNPMQQRGLGKLMAGLAARARGGF